MRFATLGSLLLIGFAAQPLWAIDFSWDAGAGTGSWQDNANWDPDGLPTDSDAVTIGDLPAAAGAAVQLDANGFARRVTLLDGVGLDTNSSRLFVRGNLLARGVGTQLVVRQSGEPVLNTSLEAFNVIIRDAATLELASTVELDDPFVAISTPGAGAGSFGELEIDAASSLVSTGGSLIRFQDGLDGGQATQLNNNGTIRVTQPAAPVVNRTYTLLIESIDAGTIVDLDGDAGTGVVEIGDFGALHVKTQSAAFGGSLSLGDNARFRFDNDLVFSDSAIVTSDAAGVGSRITAPTIAANGSATFNSDAGSLNFFGELTAAAGTQLNVADNAGIGFFGDSTISGDLDLGVGSDLRVGADVTIDRPSFDWDGQGPETVETLVSPGGELTVLADDIEAGAGDNTFDGRITIEGGAIAADAALLRTDITNDWRLGGVMRIVGSFIGEAPTGAFLNGTNNTFTIAPNGLVSLEGGALLSQSGGITVNEGTIEGHGLINSEGFSNNGLIRALAGPAGEPLFTTLARNFDLDGSDQVNPGDVEAIDGDLIIQGRLTDNFGGVATVGSGRTIDFQIGWTLGNPATLNLNGGAEPATIASSGIDNGVNVQDGEAILRGTVNVTGTGRIAGDATFRMPSTVNVTSAGDRLELEDANVVEEGAAFSGDGSVAVLAGASLSIEENGAVGVKLINSGELQVDGEAALQAYEQTAGGSFEIEIGSLSDFDSLLVTADAQLDGLYGVTLVDDFMPSDGDEFVIVSAAGGVTGQFSGVSAPLPALPTGLNWDIDYTASQVILSVLSGDPTPLDGDYNNDGVVNAADYTVWRDTLDSVTELDADGDGDGVIDQDDYDVWAANYGATAPTSSLAVPEPSAVLLVLAMLGAGAVRRR